MRKWIVRRSDLERMLDRTSSGAQRGQGDGVVGPGVSPSTGPGAVRREDSRMSPAGAEHAVQLTRIAEQRLRAAISASRSAPPSAGYPERLCAIADGLEHVASVISHTGQRTGMTWGGADWSLDFLPYELRPGGNRPVRDGLWDGFDAAFEGLLLAAAGTDIHAVAQACRDTGEQLLTVANQLTVEQAQSADPTRAEHR